MRLPFNATCGDVAS